MNRPSLTKWLHNLIHDAVLLIANPKLARASMVAGLSVLLVSYTGAIVAHTNENTWSLATLILALIFVGPFILWMVGARRCFEHLLSKHNFGDIHLNLGAWLVGLNAALVGIAPWATDSALDAMAGLILLSCVLAALFAITGTKLQPVVDHFFVMQPTDIQVHHTDVVLHTGTTRRFLTSPSALSRRWRERQIHDEKDWDKDSVWHFLLQHNARFEKEILLTHNHPPFVHAPQKLDINRKTITFWSGLDESLARVCETQAFAKKQILVFPDTKKTMFALLKTGTNVLHASAHDRVRAKKIPPLFCLVPKS